mmetsp:Transcript_42223/g.136133  ORF Transcript_42223/g.136133 Transcript_42223/m.136133 type:complete len:332 (-) Transcript_42223:39-1034(-)
MAEPRLAALCDEHEEVPAAPLPDRDATRPGKATGRGARRAKGAQKVAAERKHGDAALVVLTHKQLLARAGERPRSRDSTREAALAVRAQVTVKDANAVVLRVGDVHARRAAFLVRRCQREALRAREREWAGRGEHRPVGETDAPNARTVHLADIHRRAAVARHGPHRAHRAADVQRVRPQPPRRARLHAAHGRVIRAADAAHKAELRLREVYHAPVPAVAHPDAAVGSDAHARSLTEAAVPEDRVAADATRAFDPHLGPHPAELARGEPPGGADGRRAERVPEAESLKRGEEDVRVEGVLRLGHCRWGWKCRGRRGWLLLDRGPNHEHLST